jgi:hypothetical protein
MPVDGCACLMSVAAQLQWLDTNGELGSVAAAGFIFTHMYSTAASCLALDICLLGKTRPDIIGEAHDLLLLLCIWFPLLSAHG